MLAKLAALRHSRFARDAAVLQVAGGITSVGNLASTMALAFLLGPQLQGSFYLAVALYSLAYLIANVGLSTVTVSNVAKAVGAGDGKLVVAWLGFMLRASLLLSAGMLLMAWLALPTVATWLYDDVRVGEWATLLCLVPVAEIPRMACAAALQGTRRMGELARLENATEGLRVFFVVCMILITGEAIGAVWGTLLASASSSVMATFLYRRARADELADPERPVLLPAPREILGAWRRLPLTRGLLEGVQVGFLRNIDALLLDVLPMLFMGLFGGAAAAAYFRIAQRFLRMPLMLLQGISRTAMPAFSGIVGREGLPALRRTFYKASAAGGLMILAVLAVVVPLIPWLTRSFFPHEYWVEVPRFVNVLAAGFVVTGFSGALESFYVATGRVPVALRIGAVVGIPALGLMAVGGWLLGDLGVALGVTVTLMVGLVHHAYIAWFFRRHLGGGATPTPAGAKP